MFFLPYMKGTIYLHNFIWNISQHLRQRKQTLMDVYSLNLFGPLTGIWWTQYVHHIWDVLRSKGHNLPPQRQRWWHVVKRPVQLNCSSIHLSKQTKCIEKESTDLNVHTPKNKIQLAITDIIFSYIKNCQVLKLENGQGLPQFYNSWVCLRDVHSNKVLFVNGENKDTAHDQQFKLRISEINKTSMC